MSGLTSCASNWKLRSGQTFQFLLISVVAAAAEGADTSAVGAAAAEAVTAGGPEEAQFAQAFLQNLNFLADKARKLQVSIL